MKQRSSSVLAGPDWSAIRASLQPDSKISHWLLDRSPGLDVLDPFVRRRAQLKKHGGSTTSAPQPASCGCSTPQEDEGSSPRIHRQQPHEGSSPRFYRQAPGPPPRSQPPDSPRRGYPPSLNAPIASPPFYLVSSPRALPSYLAEGAVYAWTVKGQPTAHVPRARTFVAPPSRGACTRDGIKRAAPTELPSSSTVPASPAYKLAPRAPSSCSHSSSSRAQTAVAPRHSQRPHSASAARRRPPLLGEGTTTTTKIQRPATATERRPPVAAGGRSSSSDLSAAEREEWIACATPRDPSVRDGARLCDFAVRAGNLDSLTWLQARGCTWDEQTCAEAAEGGRLHLLQHLRAGGCAWDELTCAAAAAAGHLDCLRFAREHGCPWDHRVTTFSVAHGHLAIFDWAIAHGCEATASASRSADTLRRALQSAV